MFKWHRLEPKPGYEVIVNGQFEDRMPVYVGSEDQVYFISFAPYVTKLTPVEAPCKEGILHQVGVTVRAQFQKADLTRILCGAGYSTYRQPAILTVDEYAKRESLWSESSAMIHAYIQSASFFPLADRDATRKEIHSRIAAQCQKLGIAGEISSCTVNPVVPEPGLLAQLAAVASGNKNIETIVRYFREVTRRSEFLNAEREEAKVQAQQQIIKARTDLKVFEIQENDRIAAGEQSSKEKAEQRQMADQERNARLKAHNADLEFAYKDKRLDEDKAIAEKELEVAKARMASEDAKREARGRDMKMELDREEALSRIRSGEVVRFVEKVKELPVPDCSGLQTLIMGNDAGQPGPFGLAPSLLLSLLGKLSGPPSAQAPRPEMPKEPPRPTRP